jgi:hypothetical protein
MYQDFLLNFQGKNVSSSSHSAEIFAQIIFIDRLVPVILSCVGVTHMTSSGLDDWIYCTLYIHNSELQAIQRYRWSTHFAVHRYTHIRILSLH